MRWIGSEGRSGLPPEGYGRVLRDRPLRVRLGGGGSAGSAVCVCTSMRRDWGLALRITAPTVFSCGASRNKRRGLAGGNRLELP